MAQDNGITNARRQHAAPILDLVLDHIGHAQRVAMARLSWKSGGLYDLLRPRTTHCDSAHFESICP